jgi:NCS1 family nucleobase:cation symporter-1
VSVKPEQSRAGSGEAFHDQYRAFSLEHRGIEYIPEAERRATPWGVFWMWLSSNTTVEIVVLGALLIAVGLSFTQAVLVIIFGNLCYVFTGICSLQGPEAGTTSFVISRSSFGIRGARTVSVFNWLTQVGFEAEGVALVVLAGLVLADKAGVHASTGLKAGLIIGAALIQGVLPFFGHATMLRVLKYLALPFAAVFVLMAFLAIGKVNLGAASHSATWQVVTLGLVVVIAGGGFAWTENASDYSRYLPADTPVWKTIMAGSAGGFIPSILLEVLGAAVATGIKNATDPISGLPQVFPAWFLVPYLILAILQLYAVISIDLYSSGVTLQALIPRLRRYHCVLIDATVCAILCAFITFSSSFDDFLGDFLAFIPIWLGPWMAIYLVDWLLRRGTYATQELLRHRGGLYWRNGGWHVPGVVAQLAGMLVAAMAVNTTVWVGPISSAIGKADLSIYLGILVGGLLYYAMARKTVPAEIEPALRLQGAAPGATVAGEEAV